MIHCCLRLAGLNRKPNGPCKILACMNSDFVLSNCQLMDVQEWTYLHPGIAACGGLALPTIIPSSSWLNTELLQKRTTDLHENDFPSQWDAVHDPYQLICRKARFA